MNEIEHLKMRIEVLEAEVFDKKEIPREEEVVEEEVAAPMKHEEIEKRLCELGVVKVDMFAERRFDELCGSVELYCIPCNESYCMHIKNITVYQEEKDYQANKSEVADLLVNFITCRRGSAIVTEYYCEHCGPETKYEVQWFHKGIVFFENYVRRHESFDDKEFNGELWRN